MSSTKKLLSKQEIQESLKSLKEIFIFLEKKTTELTVAAVLKNPQIPPKISESIAHHLIQNKVILSHLKIKENGVVFGGKTCDISIKTDTKRIYKAEIKATRKDFQYFGKKDITCDCLIWIDFKAFFENSNNIYIYELENPKKYYSKEAKLSLNKFKMTCGDSLKVIEFDLSSFLG